MNNNASEKKLSYSSIIPEDLQSELISYGQATTEICFAIGDIVNRLYDGLKNTEVTHDFICSAVGFYCGKSSRTVRHYASVAKFFEKEIRDEYQILSFSHFALAKRFDDRYKEVLDYSVSNGVMSVDNVSAHFFAIEMERLYNSVKDIDENQYEQHDDIDDKLESAVKEIISVIDETVYKFENIMAKNLPNSDKLNNTIYLMKKVKRDFENILSKKEAQVA